MSPSQRQFVEKALGTKLKPAHLGYNVFFTLMLISKRNELVHIPYLHFLKLFVLIAYTRCFPSIYLPFIYQSRTISINV